MREQTHRRMTVSALSRRLFLAGSAVAALLLATARTKAQRPVDFGLTYTQERTNFVNLDAGQYFYVRGASVDFTYDLFHGLGVSATGTGLAVTNLHSSLDIHQVQFLVGPRYTYNLGHNTEQAWGRRGGAFAEAKVGYTVATCGAFPIDGTIQSESASLTYYGGAGLNVRIYHRFDLRLIEAGVQRTTLPNGGTNIQNTLRLASGVNWHFGR